MPDALTDRLRGAAGWVERQNTPAPDWDALLAEAADEIERLRGEVDSFERIGYMDPGSPGRIYHGASPMSGDFWVYRKRGSDA